MHRLRRFPPPARLLVLASLAAAPLVLAVPPPVVAAPRAADPAPAAPFEVHSGDHISIVGNTLADRMQHDGWLEAYLVSRFPDRDPSDNVWPKAAGTR